MEENIDLEQEMQNMEEGSELFEIDVGDGKTLYVEVRRGDTIRNLRERLEDVGVTMDVSVDGTTLDETTNALTYFSSLSAGKPVARQDKSEEIESFELQEEVFADDIAAMFCAVYGCTTNRFDNPDTQLFRFPNQKKRAIDWAQAINRPDLVDEPLEELPRQYAVCANHFVAAQFTNSEKKALKHTALPIVAKGNTFPDINGEESDNKEQAGETPGLVKLDPEADEGMCHPGSLCRLCANPILSNSIFIFKAEQGGKTIAEKINTCLPISVKKTDLLPKQICIVCSQHLALQHSFAEICMKADEKLREMAKRFTVNGLKKPVLTTGEGVRRGKNRQAYCCPLCCNGAMRYLCADQQDTKKKGGRDTPTLIPECTTQEFLSELYSDDEDSEGGGPTHESEAEGVDSAFSLIYLVEDRGAFGFDCDICEESFPSSHDCLAHCKVHSGSDYFPCIVCGMIFSQEDELTQHFDEHIANIPPPRRQPWKPLLECGTCNKQFTTKKDFILHKCSTPVLKVLRGEVSESCCQTCERTFKTAARAEAHKLTHEQGAATYPCGDCDFEGETARILGDHKATTHEVPLVHTCNECNLRFLTSQHLDKHQKVHQAVFYQCSVCNKTFSSLEVIETHLQTHDDDAEVEIKNECSCPKCNVSFTHSSLLQHHLEVAHDSMKRMPSLIQYQCKLCGERITTSSEVLVHRTVHFKGSEPLWPFVCEYCGEAHPSPNALARHRRFLHPDERPYVCTLCDASTRTLYEARVHRKTHTGYVSVPTKSQQKIYQCEQCPSLFSEKLAFLSHKKSHKVAKWYQCDQCDKSFPERHRLNVHKRQHTGEKPYACGTCGKKFTQTSAMYTHALLHTGETPHECDLCGRKFRIKSDRDNHRRTHTGEKPYKCQYCSKTFRTGQVYYQHRMIHTGERRFPCDVCGRAFKRSHTLVCHRRIHTGEKPNVCDVCGKGFRQRTDMRKHKMNLHGLAA